MAGIEVTVADYRIGVHDDPAAIDACAWNRLLAAQAAPTPFMRHEYLEALQASGSAVRAAGWAPAFLTLESGGRLRAAAPAYLKSHSYGEYVFDWAWADAYQRHGLRYYPKLLGAVPFTPVPGSRLLAEDGVWRERLIDALRRFAQEAGLSSAHVLFIDAAEAAAFESAGWMLRHGVQFHWQADDRAPTADFEGFLAGLQRDKRKKILQERRRVADQGIGFTVHEGGAIDPPLWDFFHHCYTRTYRAHQGTPYLTRDFFARMAATMAPHWVLFVARQGGRGGEPLGCSLIAIDPATRTAWGRYWGATRFVPCLHFEACYYQPLAWCLERGYRRFEGGAQGEHKMARGLLPVRTTSAHWLGDARFAAAVGDYLAAEGGHMAQYVDELNERNPFRPRPDGA